MEIGVVEIDIQHRTLLDIIGMIDDVVVDKSYGKKSKRILNEFHNFIIYHFNSEEAMFKKYGFVDEEHIAEHRDILRQLNELKLIECTPDCLKQVLKISKYLFESHTMKMDIKFSHYLKERENYEK